MKIGREKREKVSEIKRWTKNATTHREREKKEERRKKKRIETRFDFDFSCGCVPSKVSEKCTLAETERGVALAKTSSATKNIIRARGRNPPARE